MQVLQKINKTIAKKVVYLLKKIIFSPNIRFFSNPSSCKDGFYEYFIELDFNNSSKIYEEEDVLQIFHLFCSENKIENILIILKGSKISSNISKAINKIFDSSFNISLLDLDFSMKFGKACPFIKGVFCNMRMCKSLQVLKLSFEFIIESELYLCEIVKEFESLQLIEFYLNVNQTKSTQKNLVVLSYSLRNMATLKKLTYVANNNEIKFQKDDLIGIFRNLKELKQLNLIHLELSENPIQSIDIIYIIRKCLKGCNFPKLEQFNLIANKLRDHEFNKTKFVYYLQRKANSFKSETNSSALIHY